MFPARAIVAAVLLAPCLALSAPPAVETSLTSAAAPDRPENVVSVGAGFLLGVIGGEYERVIAEPLSLTVSVDHRPARAGDANGDAAASIWGLNVGAHVFLAGAAPTGLWLGPEVGTVAFQGFVNGQRHLHVLPRVALQVGYTGLLMDVLTVSIGAGVQMIAVAPLPNVRLSLGYAF